MTTYAYAQLDAGRNNGAMPWRDPTNPQFAYQLRDTNHVYLQNVELVKINVETGAEVQGGVWAYASALEELGACFTNEFVTFRSNVVGSASGTKLYLGGSTIVSPNVVDAAIVEFDKTTMEVTQHWATQTGFVTFDATHSNAPPDFGVSVMSGDGTLFANGGITYDTSADGFTTRVFNHSAIQLLRTTNGDYGLVDLSSIGITGCLGYNEGFTSPLVFDADDFLWFITQPVVTVAGTTYRLSGPSTLYKCSISGSPTLTLTVEASWAIADDYLAYGNTAFAHTFSYKHFVFNSDTNKINMFSAYDNFSDWIAGWYLEWDVDAESFTRGPLSWTPGEAPNLSQQCNETGWCRNDFLVVFLPIPKVFSVFKISTSMETTYDVTLWGVNPDDFFTNQWTIYYSAASFEIYAFNAIEDFPDYSDALFTVVDAGAQTYNRVWG